MNGHFLIVEDNQPSRALIGEFLTSLGRSFQEAKNGREAIDLIGKDAFDGMFLDIMMPESDGFEVLTWMMKTDHVLPTVVFTEGKARFDVDFPSMAERLGALKGYDKPVTLDKVREAVALMEGMKGSSV
tara:strand:+ start:662 stop:1048 length:387 start_codon:yes stop_codon:yes gene_type:complete